MALDSCSKCRINPRLIVILVAKKDYDILDFMINNMSYSTMLCLDCKPSFFVTIQGVEGGERPAQNARPESRTPTPGVPATVKT